MQTGDRTIKIDRALVIFNLAYRKCLNSGLTYDITDVSSLVKRFLLEELKKCGDLI